MRLYTVGDSFTYGQELSNPSEQSWPHVLGKMLGYTVDNHARPGASNDYIVRQTVEYLEQNQPDLVIIGWTIEDRIEISGKTANPRHNPTLYKLWNEDWAMAKLQAQIITLDKYVLRDIPHYHCATWIDDFYFKGMNNYLGRFVDWAYDAPRGLDGHPLEEGHKLIADEILKHI